MIFMRSQTRADVPEVPVRRSARVSSMHEERQFYLTLEPGEKLYRGEAAGSGDRASGNVAFFALSYEVAQKYATKGKTINMYTLKTPVRLVNVCNREVQGGKDVDSVAYTDGKGNCRRTSVLLNDISVATALCRPGTLVNGFATIGAKNFHDEVALCQPKKHVTYPPIDIGVSVDKKRPAKRRTAKVENK